LTLLDNNALTVVAILERAELPLPVRLKRRIRTWVDEATQQKRLRPAEIPVTRTIFIRVTPELVEVVKRGEEYLQRRDRYIERNPEIKGGVPVIRGTRLGVYAVASRVSAGDTIEDLVEDYPNVPREAFETALLYARAHPRRGRPSRRPWREA
jgi:uncharacterized protein (DUF433 family)